jgi:hypothetical protein
MTTVMLETDEELLAKAKEALAKRNLSLEEFWANSLREAAEGEERLRRHDVRMEGLRHVDLRGPYTRDEMNER